MKKVLSLRDLDSDYVHNNGAYMILTAKEGIHSSELNKVQCGMITTVNIPRLLRVDVKQVDYQVSFHYEITGRKMLSQSLRSDKIEMPEFYALLLQLVGVLMDSKQYMLEPSNYLIHEQHIFVDGSLADGILYFVYVPLQHSVSVQPVQHSILSLIIRMMTSVRQLEGMGIQRVIQLCNSELFSLEQLNKLLLELMTDGDQLGTSRSLREEYGGIDKPVRLPMPDTQVNENLLHQGRNQSSGEIYRQDPHQDEQMEGAGAVTSSGPITGPRRTYVLLATVLLIVMCWKLLYLDMSSPVMLYVCAATTLLIGSAALWIIRGGISFSQGISNNDASLPSLNPTNEKGSKWDGWSLDQLLSGGQDTSTGRKTSTWASEQDWRWNDMYLSEQEQRPVATVYAVEKYTEDENTLVAVDAGLEDSYYERLGNKTELLSYPKQETVLLRDNKVKRDAATETVTRYLERIEHGVGVTERIELPRGSFVIGRAVEVVQYVDKTLGTSRAHVELLLTESTCVIKDLGSKNGTKMNGEDMAPYKEYPIKSGDTFSIATTTFTLH